MNRTERFYKLKSLLLTRPSVNLLEMQEALEVSRATLYRDLNYMRDRLGMPFDYHPALRGYAMTLKGTDFKRYELPGLWFSQPELYSLLTIIEVISKLEQSGSLLAHVMPLRSRLEGLLDDGTAYRMAVRQRISIVPSAQRQISSEHFQITTIALTERRRLNIKYLSPRTGHSTERIVSPQRLVYYRGNWCLDSYCHWRQGLRRFALYAVTSLSLSEQTAHDISAEEWQDMPATNYNTLPGAERHTAKLKFMPSKAQWVSRELWHCWQSGSLSSDGSYVLEVPYANDTELIQDILAHGPDVQVLCPLALRQKVADTIKNMMSVYA